MTHPTQILTAVQPLFDALPASKAMQSLVVTQSLDDAIIDLADQVMRESSIAENPALCAGLWLYVDELDRSHDISQGIHDSRGSFWHGIMHRREGDFSNSHYWFNRVGQHPAMDTIGGYDPHSFIDDVQARHSDTPADLIAMQHAEWSALFAWCAQH